VSTNRHSHQDARNLMGRNLWPKRNSKVSCRDDGCLGAAVQNRSTDGFEKYVARRCNGIAN
jgi:hypothetical protein